MKIGKSSLSQYLRTQCDRQLYLSLFDDAELKANDLPLPIKSRPVVHILREQGKQWEQAKFQELQKAFGPIVLGHQDEEGNYTDIDLLSAISGPHPPTEACIIQGRFDHRLLAGETLRNIGTTDADIATTPRMTAMIPDILWLGSPRPAEQIVMPDGSRQTSAHTNKAMIRTCDIKNAGESNSGYASEVALYALLLSNWLKLTGLDQHYAVSADISLWTRQKGTSAIIDAHGTEAYQQKMSAFQEDTERVDFPIYMQAIRHFFTGTLPRVLNTPDWRDLDWHVDSRCSSCDWLGHPKWLTPEGRALVDARPEHYCYENARRLDHLSRIALISKGARRTLRDHGINTTATLAAKTPSEPAFDSHNTLRANKKRLAGWAAALSGRVQVAPHGTCNIPRRADLELFITVNHDPGTNLLTGLGLVTRRQYTGTNTPAAPRRAKGGVVVQEPTREAEGEALLHFLATLSKTIRQEHNDPHGAADMRTQLYFWNKGQYMRLTDAIGRHLDQILAEAQRFTTGLPWLFPPSKLLRNHYLTTISPMTFIQDIVKRNLFLPVEHAITLFNTAEAYLHEAPTPLPGPMHRDIFTDAIPRQRIYEIWADMPLVETDGVQLTRSQCIEQYAETVKQQARALAEITWKLKKDLSARLTGEASRLNLDALQKPNGMNPDSRLWLGWARLEEACSNLNHKATFNADPEELEARYESMRLTRMTERKKDGTLIYDVQKNSRDVKFTDTEKFLALQDEKIQNFLNLKVKDLTAKGEHTLPGGDKTGNMRLLTLYQATLTQFDRVALRAGIKLAQYGDIPQVRDYLEKKGLVDITHKTALVSAPGPSPAEKTERCLQAIGDPPDIDPQPSTLEALGEQPPPQSTPLQQQQHRTTASLLLWNPKALSIQPTGIGQHAAEALTVEARRCGALINESQAHAIINALTHRLSIIWGPPGTGKTKTAAALALSLIMDAHQKGRPLRLLLTGPTYIAWEQLMESLIPLLDKTEGLQLQAYRIYSASYQDPAPAPPTTNERIRITDARATKDDKAFSNCMAAIHNPGGITIVGAVAHTCYRLLPQYPQDAIARLFDAAIIDESSQLDINHALPVINTLDTDALLTLCGDHLQMPPITQTDPPAGAETMVGSIQTYLKERFAITPTPLLVNYRSGRAFVAFAKEIGYPEELSSNTPDLSLQLVPGTATQPPAQWPPDRPYTEEYLRIIDPAKPLVAITYPDGRSGQANEFEGQTAVSLALMLRHCTVNDNTAADAAPDKGKKDSRAEEKFWTHRLGIVTPHRAQRSLIIRHLKHAFPRTPAKLIEKSVDTVERFQGGQRQTIIISFGIGDPDLIQDEEAFLLQLERTNVAISRAMAKCIVLISEDLAYHLPGDSDVIRNSRAIKTYVDEFCRRTAPMLLPDGRGDSRAATLRWWQD